jgi:hypothetical protein
MSGRLSRVRVSDLRFLSEAWPREDLDRGRVAEFQALYEAEGPEALPPIELVHAPQLDGYLVTDGWHRSEALHELEWEEAIATVLAVPAGQSPESFAYRRGLECSARASKPLTRREKQHAIERLLRELPDESDRAIARLVGVDHKTVGRIREWGISPPREESRPQPSAADQARRLLRAFGKAYETRGLGVADFFLGERSGERFAAVFREVYGEDAMWWAQSMRGWLDAAIEALPDEEPEEG